MNGVRKDHAVMLMAGALVLFLAACSGSNDGVRDDRDMYKEQAEALTEQLETLRSEIEMVTGERDTVQSEVESLDADVARLTREITALTSARDGYQARLEALQNAGREEDRGEIAELTNQINTLDSRIDGLELELEGDGTDANPGLRQQLADLQMELDGEEFDSENPGLRQKLMELQAERDQLAAEKETYDALEEEVRRAEEEAERKAEEERLAQEAQERIVAANALWATQGTARPGDNYIFDTGTSSSGRSGRWGDNNMVANSVRATRDADGLVTVTVPGYNSGSAPAHPSGWTPVTVTKDDGEIATVLHTIEPPISRPFNSVYDTNARENVLGGSGGGDVARRSVAEAAQFPEPSSTKQFGADTGNPDEFMGTLDGVAGSYICKDPAAGCSVTRNSDGTLAAVDGWRFRPNSNRETVLVQGGSNGHWGWWVRPGNPGSYGMYETGGGRAWTDGNPDTQVFTGRFTFSGVASGIFATKSFRNGIHVDSDSGTFFANADVAVDWSDGVGRGDMSGTITNILLNDDTEPVSWSVRLNEKIAYWGSLDGTTSIDYGGGVVTGNVGEWFNYFRGGSYSGGTVTEHPTRLRGGFSAFTNFIRITGVFGTTRNE